MQRKSAIYFRTSSEFQGEKVSHAEQVADCRSLAQEKELTVARIYRDIEKYRVKNKLVEPSGPRADCPGLFAMFDDAARCEFNATLASLFDLQSCTYYLNLRFTKPHAPG